MRRAAPPGAAWLLCIVCIGCAGPRAAPPLAAPPEHLDRPWTEAAAARAAAVDRRRLATLDGVELRVRDISVDNVSAADGVDFAVRLPLSDNPWLIDATDEVWRAEADLELLELADVVLAEDARLCLHSAEHQVHARRLAAYDATVGHLEDVLAWNQDWAAAGTLDELTAAELELELGLWLADEAPTIDLAARADEDALAARFALPDPAALEASTPEPDAVAARIRAQHPVAREHTARAELHRLEAERESAAALPWFDFFELSYRIGPDAGPGAIAAQIAVAFPFGVEAGGEADRYEQLAVSEDHESDAVVEWLTDEALDALGTLDEVARRRDAVAALLESAERAEAIALRWRDERLGSPRQVSRVLRDAHAARELALREQLRAAEAQCRLLATGYSAPRP